jgi:O-antigen/teichoic acid export membrane protein
LSHVEIARRSTRGSVALFAGNFLTTAISFVAIVIIARLLGPGNYGVYTLSVLIPNILLNLLGFGVSSGITRYAAYHLSRDRPDLARRMTLNGIAFVLLFGVVLTLISYASAGFLSGFVLRRPEIANLLQYSSLIILVQAVFVSGVAGLLGWSYMGNISVTNVIQSALRLAIAVPLVALGFAVYGALTGYILSVGLGGLLALFLLIRKMGGLKTRPLDGFSEDVRTLLSYGWALFVGQFASNISAQYVVVILAAIAANTYVGFYQSANNFVTAITLTSGAMTQALFPAFAHLEGTKGDLERAFKLATKYMGFVLSPIIFLLMGASVQIIGVSFGSSYSTASTYLSLLALSNVSLIFGQGVLISFFNGVGRPRLYMAYSLAGAGTQFVLAPLLTFGLGLGIPGLIVSIFASNTVAVVSGLYFASRNFKAKTDLAAALSILGSSVLGFFAVLPLEVLHYNSGFVLVLEVLVFAFVYLTAAPLLRAIGPDDIAVLTSSVQGLGSAKSLLTPILAYEQFIIRRSHRS